MGLIKNVELKVKVFNMILTLGSTSGKNNKFNIWDMCMYKNKSKYSRNVPIDSSLIVSNCCLVLVIMFKQIFYNTLLTLMKVYSNSQE